MIAEYVPLPARPDPVQSPSCRLPSLRYLSVCSSVTSPISARPPRRPSRRRRPLSDVRPIFVVLCPYGRSVVRPVVFCPSVGLAVCLVVAVLRPIESRNRIVVVVVLCPLNRPLRRRRCLPARPYVRPSRCRCHQYRQYTRIVVRPVCRCRPFRWRPSRCRSTCPCDRLSRLVVRPVSSSDVHRYKVDVASTIKACVNSRVEITKLIESLMKVSTPSAPKRDSAGALALTAQGIV